MLGFDKPKPASTGGSKKHNTSKRHRVSLRNSLSYHQTRNAVLVAFLIGIVLSSVQIYLDYFSQKNELDVLVGDVLVTANNAAFHAAYNLDERGAEQITQGLISNLPIVSATIHDDSGTVLGAATKEVDIPQTRFKRLLFGNQTLIDKTLFDAGIHDKPVGKLIVLVDPSLTADNFIQRSFVVFGSGIVRNFFLAICLIALFYYTTTRPILKASQPIQEGNADQLIPLPESHKKDEIGVFINAFNDHLATIKEQHQQILEVNENLENTVESRTTELRKEREKALRNSQEKSEFLAMMSHEIRTPMNGILGMSEILQKSTFPPQHREYLDAIHESSKSLLSLMSSALDYSKYEQGAHEFEHKPFDLHGLIHSIVFSTGSSAELRGLTLTEHIDPAVPKYVYGDPDRLRQVFLNLINNAVKFTDKGSISVTAEIDSAATTRGESSSASIRFSVVDTGVGIAEEARDKIFRPYNQADQTISQRFGGTGLGLTICKEIVEQQGGSIGFTSTVDQGSTFWFRMSFDISESTAVEEHIEHSKAQIAAQPVPRLNILVVDDIKINRKLMSAQLAGQAKNILMAADGKEALELLRENAIDLVFMDVHMPVLDGIETTRMIRADEETATVKIVGVTANINSKTREQCQRCGMDLVLSKPVNQSSLNSAIRSLFDDTDGDSSVQTLSSRESEEILLDMNILQEHQNMLGDERTASLYQEADLSARDLLKKLKETPLSSAELLEEYSHSLAGLCSNFGFVQTGILAQNIETTAINNPDALTSESLDDVQRSCEKTLSLVATRL